MHELNIANQKCTVMGIQGSGKTVFTRHLAKHYKTLVYSPHAHDWNTEKKVHLITPASLKKPFVLGMEEVIRFYKKSNFDLLIIDEADMIFKSNFDIRPYTNDMVINHRHYKKSIIFVTRRPQDIPTKILESCKYLIIYVLEGANAVKRLEETRKGLGKMAASLDFDEHKFIIKEIGKDPVISEPVPCSDK